jgi:transcriptional regulator
MYMPPQFNAKDVAHARALIRENPFASLITTDDDGLPYVTHLPLHLLASAPAGQGDDAAAEMLLLGHVARPNPHWRYLLARPQSVVTFLGPHAYMSPSVYPDLARVPTWNYLAVHCTVQAQVIESFEDTDALLKHLIADHEPAYAQQWRDLGEEFAQKMVRGIVPFTLRVTQLQCKLKLNQHRPESHAALHAIYAAGNDDQRALAEWMQRLGMLPTGDTPAP